MSRRVLFVCLAALFALSVYRAAAQSFTTDEAFSYQLYIGATPFSLFRTYDANLHVLHTLAVWLSVHVFGLSELAFRLPSLGACVLYFAAVYRLCGRAFGSGPLFLVAGLTLAANPLVLDHMAIGRGYGLALACFAWAFYEALRVAQGPDGRLFCVAVWLALSVASNLTFLFPAAALGAMLLLWRPRVPGFVADLAAPAGVFTFLLIVLPFSRMNPGQLYFGSPDFTTMDQTLAEWSIGGRHLDAGFVNGFAALLFVGAAVAAVRGWGNARAPRIVGLTSGTFALTAVAVAASHVGFGLPLPWGRTGLYFLFLAPLFLAAVAKSLRGPAYEAGVAILALLAVAMASGIRADRYLEWPFDASSREMIAQIRERRAVSVSGHHGRVRVAASPPLERTLALYRAMYGLDWIAAIADDPRAPGFDYYVLRAEDRGRVPGLREIFESDVSGAALAVPAGGR